MPPLRGLDFLSVSTQMPSLWDWRRRGNAFLHRYCPAGAWLIARTSLYTPTEEIPKQINPLGLGFFEWCVSTRMPSLWDSRGIAFCRSNLSFRCVLVYVHSPMCLEVVATVGWGSDGTLLGTCLLASWAKSLSRSTSFFDAENPRAAYHQKILRELLHKTECQ